MKTVTGVIIGAVLVVLITMGVLSYQKNNQKEDDSGTLFIGITDATADISDVNDIDLSVKKVEVHTSARGWITASSNMKSYKLLSLNESGKTELYAETNISAGTYDKVRITLGDAVVKTKSKGDIKATLPSSYIVMDTGVIVKENASTSVKLDVLADQSLHMTAEGGYVFAPVVKAESRSNATVSVGSDNAVSVSGGTLDGSTSVGVDLSGMSKSNFRLETDNSLKVESSVAGKMKFILGGKTYEETDISGEVSSANDANVEGKGSLETKSDSDKKGSLDVGLDTKIRIGQ
jgi:hypothetical protein